MLPDVVHGMVEAQLVHGVREDLLDCCHCLLVGVSEDNLIRQARAQHQFWTGHAPGHRAHTRDELSNEG